MAETLQLFIDGRQTDVPEGTTVAVAIMISGKNAFRRSVAGELRGPLCGMGICFECRATIDCQTLCVEGMEVVTDGV
jgi:hypothetical protein